MGLSMPGAEPNPSKGNPLMKQLYTFLALSCFLLIAAPASAQDDAQKEKLVREMMELTGAADIGMQVLDGMLAQLESSGVPPQFVDKFRELAKPEDLVELIVPLYVRTYNKKTLRAAITFYKTPAGKALLAGTPLITQESMILGQKWGAELAAKVQASVEAEKSTQKSTEPQPAAP